MFKKSQKQNNSLLDSILSNIQPNLTMSKLTQFIQNNNQSLEFSRQQMPLDPCSKHQQKKGEYFETSYPWIKYCQNCALNLALCGKKIQKSLSSEQMVAKIKLCDTLHSIAQAIKISQQSHNEYSFLSTELQNSRQWFVSIVGQVDALISQLTQIRTVLEQNVQNYVNKEIKDIFEKQSLIVSKKIQLINEKSQIQCGFVELIGKQNQEETLKIIKEANKLIQQANQLLSTEQCNTRLSQNVKNVEALFEEKLTEIRQLQFCSPLNEPRPQQQNDSLRMSVAFTKKVLNYRTSKTQQTLGDDVSYEQGKRLLTACSTVQHSGLVTPSELLNSNETMPLRQVSQNRRNSRTALQLKARCRSRSGQKKVEVNVRQSVDTVIKKKLA